MKCSRVQKKLLHYIDKDLSARASKPIRAHLLECEACERRHTILQETEKSLHDLGAAVRAGHFPMKAPRVPPLEQPSFWTRIRKWFGMRIPLWVPSAAGAVVILMFAVSIFSPLNLSIEWGARKGGENTGPPPLSAEGMLEFLIVPEPTDAGQLAASIEAVETFLKMHPEDLAMHVKLVELYQSRLKLGSLTTVERDALAEKLSLEQRRFLELLENFTKGAHNVSK